VERAVGHLGNVRLFHVLAADAGEDFAVYPKLPVSAIVIVGSPNHQATGHHEQHYGKRDREN